MIYRLFRPLLLAALAVVSLDSIVSTPPLAAQETPFKLTANWKLGGDGSWDYMVVDEAAHLLYIARLDRFMAVDLETGKLAGEVAGLQHAHGVALAPDGKTGYISDGGAGTVVVFDRKTMKATGTIPTGKNPDAILLEPTRKLLFVFNGASNSATVIDPATTKVVGTIPMPGKPEFSVTDGTGNVFVNIEDTNQVLRIDAASMKVAASWSLGTCKAPSGLAIDRTHHRLFSVCDNARMAIVDSTSGKVVATPAIGEGADAVVYDDKRGLVLSSNGESGTLTILKQETPDRYRTLQTLKTQVGARTLALNPASGTIYTVSAQLGRKPPVTAQTPKPKAPIAPGTFVVLSASR